MMSRVILMTEEYWRASQFSVARFYGGLNIGQKSYKIVNRYGITLEELSDPKSKHYKADGMAIEPGEPADLIQQAAIPAYKKLGRPRFIELLKEGADLITINAEAGL